MKQEHVIETCPTVRSRSANKVFQCVIVIVNKSIDFGVKRRKEQYSTFLDVEKLVVFIPVSKVNTEYYSSITSIWWDLLKVPLEQ